MRSPLAQPTSSKLPSRWTASTMGLRVRWRRARRPGEPRLPAGVVGGEVGLLQDATLPTAVSSCFRNSLHKPC
jgi:hypothetical protein